MTKKIALLFIFLTSINSLFAQYNWSNAELHLKNGKVLTGEAKIPMKGAGMNLGKETLRYRSNKKDKVSTFKPQEIDSVLFTIDVTRIKENKKITRAETKIFKPVFINKKETRLGFVEVLVDGELKLVGRNVIINFGGNSGNVIIEVDKVVQDDYMGNYNQIMLLKKGEKPLVFYRDTDAKYFKKKVSQLFEDCPTLVEKINNDEFDKEDIQKLVSYYNLNCI